MTHALHLVAPVDTLAIEFSREFAAPSTALFRAHADPALIEQWLGPRDLEMSIDRWDFRSGGRYRYLHSRGGEQFAFNGVFHTVRENELIIQTFEFEGAPDMVNIEFMWFEELRSGRSLLRGRSICPNVEARDGLLSSGMEGGMAEGYAKLDELLAAG